jgi:peptidoglycan/xylan/chitin deacetylase (PgdA/CDA1 family)
MSAANFAPLVAVLDAWAGEGRIAQFWLRDDDAVEPTPALSRLLALCERFGVPATLAVIPAHTGEPLAEFLAGRPAIDVALHGWSHHNHASPDEKKQELGSHRSLEIMLGELDRGAEHLRKLFADSFVPVLVPPWNRIDKALLPQLADIGIEALSVFGPEKSGPVVVVNTHADIMDWHGTRRCRAAHDIVADIIKRLHETERTGASMGLLTHHLVHDEAAWEFLEGLFAATAGHPACRWVALSDLLPSSR